MNKARNRNMDVSGTMPEGSAALHEQPAEHASQAQDAPGNRPVWSRQLNRVHCSVWPRTQNGQTRHSISISRSYLDKRNNVWKRVYSFDRNDLKDVRLIVNEAEEKILTLEGFEQSDTQD